MASRADLWWMLAWTLAAGQALSESDGYLTPSAVEYRPPVGSSTKPVKAHIAADILHVTHNALHNNMGAAMPEQGVSTMLKKQPLQATPTSSNAQYGGGPLLANVSAIGMDVMVTSSVATESRLFPLVDDGNAQPVYPFNVSFWDVITEGSSWVVSAAAILDSSSSPRSTTPILLHAPPTSKVVPRHYQPQGAVWGSTSDGHQPMTLKGDSSNASRSTTPILLQAPPTSKVVTWRYQSQGALWGSTSDGYQPTTLKGDSAHASRSTTPIPRHAPPTDSRSQPHYHPRGARWGPYFEDGPQSVNVTARVGSIVTLDCRIAMLQGKMVTWLHRARGQLRLLTVGRQAYSADGRLAILFRYPDNWRLRISRVSPADQGEYQCQVSTHPPLVKTTILAVTAPELSIVDEYGRRVEDERYYKAGSQVELSCLAMNLHPGEAVSWRRLGANTSLPHRDDSNSSLVVSHSGEARATLAIARALKRHSGEYTCVAGNTTSVSVSVHVLNGEIPAAVHHGNQAAAVVPRLAALLVCAAVVR